jgi:hypothetical protein
MLEAFADAFIDLDPGILGCLTHDTRDAHSHVHASHVHAHLSGRALDA